MTPIHIKKGYDLKVSGKPHQEIVSAPHPKSIAIQPPEFHGLKPKLLVKEGDLVKGGSPLFFDKKNPGIKVVSPHAGTVTSIKYGERRVVNSIIIKPDAANESLDFGAKTANSIEGMKREEAISWLQDTGAFAYIRQRPFNKIPEANRVPKSIFINAMNTEPNALNQGFILKDRKEELQLGINILKKLTHGFIHLCYSEEGDAEVFKDLKGVKNHTFSGPHPSGLVGTHIHFIDPINKGDIVWYLDSTRLASIGSLLKTGHFDPEKIVAVSGHGVKIKKYFKTIIGADVESLLAANPEVGEQRFISGTVLYGVQISRNGHILFYENSLQVIPEGRKRHFLRWAQPGSDQFSAISRTFISSFSQPREWTFNTNLNGSGRAIVWTDVYDRFTPLDIYTNFLVKAVLAEDVEEAEKLGILEVAEEDFALATFLCPSKVDVSGIIGKGLQMVEKEGY